MSERLDLFTTPLLKAVLPDAPEHNSALLSAIQEERARSAGIKRSNLGGWHSDTNMMDWAGPSAMELAQFATTVSGAQLADINPGGKRDFSWRVEMWANINAPGDANQTHCHPGCVWSGVYYVDPGGAESEDGGGELVLEDPRYPMAYMATPGLVMRASDGEPARAQVAVRPEPGLLVLFPSWLRHSVNPHRGNRARVSIALNLILVAVGQA